MSEELGRDVFVQLLERLAEEEPEAKGIAFRMCFYSTDDRQALLDLFTNAQGQFDMQFAIDRMKEFVLTLTELAEDVRFSESKKTTFVAEGIRLIATLNPNRPTHVSGRPN